MRLKIGIALTIALLISFANQCWASVMYSTPGATYSENFNGLPTDMPSNASIQSGTTAYVNGWQDDATTVAGDHVSVPGWYLWHPIAPTSEGGTNGHQRLRVGVGANTGGFWLFGPSNSDPEKALGSLGSTTVAANNDNEFIAVRLTNNTGVTLYKFTVNYDGEEWRDGQLATPETLSFGYNLGATTTGTPPNWADPTTTFTAVPSLNFTSPVFSGTGSSGTAVDGNSAGKVAGITATVSGISWDPGTDLWLRWADPQAPSAADDGLGIDNFSFSADVPEPSSLILFGTVIFALGLAARRRQA
jgi:hypothetical protein